jgi:hypothetical protein
MHDIKITIENQQPMTKQQKMILDRLRALLAAARSNNHRAQVREQIAAVEKHCKPRVAKPQPPWERVCLP